MAFIKTKLSTIRPNDLYDTLRLTYGFNNEEDQKQPGILAKPAEPVSDSDVVAAGFFDYMLTKSRERAAKLRAEAMEQYARDSAEEAAKIRSILGITRSKAPTGQLSETARTAMFSGADMQGADLTMRDNAREAQDVVQPMITPVSRGEQPEMADSPAPVDAPSVDTRSNEMLDKAIQDVLETVVDSDVSDSTDSADGGAAPSGGKGIMSPAEGATSFATIIKAGVSETVDATVPLSSGFASLTEAEGTDIHLDGRGFVTLPFGIVPDKNSVKKSDGTTFNPTGKHGLTTADLSGVDYSKATKFGVSRADYDNDKDFAKAVYAEFGKQTATKYGEGFGDLTDNAKQAAYDIAWNAGIGSADWPSVKTMLQEASKEGTKSKDSLIGFTTNFKSGTDYPRGVLKRRLQTYNLVANEDEKAASITTTAVMTDKKRTGTLYTIKDANGAKLKTWTKPDTDEKLGDLEVPL